MRSRWPAIPLLLVSMGCMKTLPPMPGVAVVTPMKAAVIAESGSAPAEALEEDDGEDPEAEYVTPCKASSIAHHAGEIAFDSFDKKVRALPPSGDPKPLEEALETLLDHPCFEIAKADPKELLTFTSGASLNHWWKNGGSDWLYSYLRAEERRYLRIAPTPRRALTLETAPKDHPLIPLLCPTDESKPCAVESAGWARRAQETLSLVASRRRHAKDEVDCQEEAVKEPKAGRYAAYRDCLEQGFERQQAMPLGRFKAPSDGWLVMHDQHGSCTTMRAFHLVSGSTYSAEDCGSGASGAPRTVAGRVPVGALREAAWMLLFARETQADVRLSQGYHVPENFPIKRARGESIGLGMIGCSCGTSQRRSWSWMREKNGALRGQVSGVIVGRGDDDAIRHAFDLLDIATAAMEHDCAPSLPPARIAWSSPGPSAREGEVAVLDDASSETVRNTLVKAKAARTCTPKP